MAKQFFTARCSQGRAVATGYVVDDEDCDQFIRGLAQAGLVITIAPRGNDPIDWCAPDGCANCSHPQVI